MSERTVPCRLEVVPEFISICACSFGCSHVDLHNVGMAQSFGAGCAGEFAIMDGLAKALENLCFVRKRFRKDGATWIREPPTSRGSNPLRTTAALKLNASILNRVLVHMPTAKLPVALLEDQAPYSSRCCRCWHLYC